MRRWIFGVLATFAVTAAIAVPLLTGSGNPRSDSRSGHAYQVVQSMWAVGHGGTVSNGSASFYPLGSAAYRRFCERHKRACAVLHAMAGGKPGTYMYSPATARLVKSGPSAVPKH